MSGIVRGCGSRVKAGVYLEISTSPWGKPLEQFLVDPPIKISVDMCSALGISPIGVKIIQGRDTVANIQEPAFKVWDIIGEKFYPNVCDILEEGRRFGFSR